MIEITKYTFVFIVTGAGTLSTSKKLISKMKLAGFVCVSEVCILKWVV